MSELFTPYRLGLVTLHTRTIGPDWWSQLWIPFCKVLPMCALHPIRKYTMKFQK